MSSEIEILLEAVFDDAFSAGGDITLERQFENGRENYQRYRARAIKETSKALASLLTEARSLGVGTPHNPEITELDHLMADLWDSENPTRLVGDYVKQQVWKEADEIYTEYSFGGKSEYQFGKWLKDRIATLNTSTGGGDE